MVARWWGCAVLLCLGLMAQAFSMPWTRLSSSVLADIEEDFAQRDVLELGLSALAEVAEKERVLELSEVVKKTCGAGFRVAAAVGAITAVLRALHAGSSQEEDKVAASVAGEIADERYKQKLLGLYPEEEQGGGEDEGGEVAVTKSEVTHEAMLTSGDDGEVISPATRRLRVLRSGRRSLLAVTLLLASIGAARHAVLAFVRAQVNGEEELLFGESFVNKYAARMDSTMG